MKTEIIIRTQFEDFHFYESAPEQVSFLRARHRHIFHVAVKIEVFHDDRELEYFIVKEALDTFIKNEIKTLDPKKSCELMAFLIAKWAAKSWPIPEADPIDRKRAVSVEVSEDGENGSIVTLGA